MAHGDIQFEADDASDSFGVSILYPILGSVFVIVCVVSIAAFILSHRRCRKHDPNNTESKLLNDNLCKEKQKMAQSNLVYNMDGKPVYTSITQQEDNEIAHEVRETYKTIATSDNKPIDCCPSQAGYSYHPIQNTDETPSSETVKANCIDVNTNERNETNEPVTCNQEFLTKQHRDVDSSPSNRKNERLFDSLEKRLSGIFYYDKTEQTSSPVTTEVSTQLGNKHKATKQSEGNVKDLLMNKWIQEGDAYVDEFESSCKTNMELNFEDVESILTSVSRMDTRRVQKLKDTSFYQNLKHNKTTASAAANKPMHSPQYSEDSIEDADSLDNTTEDFEDENNKHSLSHEEILTLESPDNLSISDENDNATIHHRNQISHLPAMKEICNKQSFKKPVQYIDGDSESFFKIVRPVINPDEFSESSKTPSENFKRSKCAPELTESILSENTYSYDKHSHFIIIDDQTDKKNNPSSLRPRMPSTPSTKTPSQTSVSTRIESIPYGSRPYSLDLEQRNNDLSIDMSTSYDSELFSTEVNSITSHSQSSTRHSGSSKPSVRSQSSSNTHNNARLNPSSSIHSEGARQFLTDKTSSDSEDDSITSDNSSHKTKSEKTEKSSATSATMSSATSTTSEEPTTTHLRSKYKSRGNFSTYISSRQCAASAKTGGGTNGKLNDKKDGKQQLRKSTTQKRVKRSPGARMFRRSPKN